MATPKQHPHPVVIVPAPKPWSHHADEDPNYREAYVSLPNGGRKKVAPKLDA